MHTTEHASTATPESGHFVLFLTALTPVLLRSRIISIIGRVFNRSTLTINDEDKKQLIAFSTSKKGRGISRGVKLIAYRINSGHKPHITFPEGKYQPIGGWSKVFESMVGVICREHARMTCGTWSRMESANKATFYHHIQENFVIDLENSRIRSGLDKWLAARFQSHKNRMHMHFKSFRDDIVERARRKPYRNVHPGNWQAICENFMTPTFQA
ncbi:uncharacterized protein LOC132277662 [Cornus florida]|uniref:uncharacterized protein LOC132277662 n=1 Tax=Cornus florida TaxID=4283 RepID=UPI00289B416D|nr:uncharacterized protein LOC132277662 [Cornus florida]